MPQAKAPITIEYYLKLKRRAEKLGCSMADVIRQALVKYLDGK